MDYSDYSEQVKNLGTRVLDEGTRAWERYFQIMGETSAGKWSAEEMQKRFAHFAQDEGTEFVRKLMQCHVDYYVSIMNAGLDLSASMLESVFAPVCAKSGDTGQQTSGATSKQEPRTEMLFEGKRGETHSQAFVIANKQPQQIEVSFELSEFISEDGKTKTRVPVGFTPHQFVLDPGQEQVVECQLTFEETLKPGQRYSALARVVGFPDMMVRLMVTPQNA